MCETSEFIIIPTRLILVYALTISQTTILTRTLALINFLRLMILAHTATLIYFLRLMIATHSHSRPN